MPFASGLEAARRSEGGSDGGRTELLRWVNTLLDVSYEKVEQLSNGAAYCQIIDATYPGKVSLSRVNYGAYLPNNIQENYKVLQQMFSRCRIQHGFDVTSLMKGRFQDNYQFLIWLRQHHESVVGPDAVPYNAAARRRQFSCKVPASIATATSNSVSSTSASSQQQPLGISTAAAGLDSVAKRRPRTSDASVAAAEPPATRPRMGSSSTAVSSVSSSFSSRKPSLSVFQSAADNTERVNQEDNRADKGQVSESKYAELQYTLEGVEKERDFYYGRLREIEDLCRAERAAIAERAASAAGGVGSATGIGDEAVDRFAERLLQVLGQESSSSVDDVIAAAAVGGTQTEERPLFVRGMGSGM